MLPIELYDQGVLVVPCATAPSDKRPKIEYSHWREGQKPTRDEMAAIWSRFPDAGLLMLCEGIECIDLDIKNEVYGMDIIADFERELRSLDEALLGKVLIQKTPSGGRHYIYRTDNPGASCTLARRAPEPGEKSPATLVDYLAHGKLCRIYPTPGYEVLQGAFDSVPVITDEERRCLISAAISLNTYYEQPSYRQSQASAGQDRPGDDYNDRVEIDEILDLLQRHGFRYLRTRGDYVHLNRPGARNAQGTDATVNISQRWFYAWSSSTDFMSGKAIRFFHLYAHLEHRGDFAKAAKELASKSYGAPAQPQNNTAANTPLPNHFTPAEGRTAANTTPSQPDWVAVLSQRQFDYSKQTDAKFRLFHTAPLVQDAKPIPVGGEGMIVGIKGQKKSFKSQAMKDVVAAAINAGTTSPLGFSFDFSDCPDYELVHFDTEQGELWYEMDVKSMHWMAGHSTNIPHFKSFSLRPYAYKERMAMIEAYVLAHPNLKVVFIDGLLDLAQSYESNDQATEVMQFLMRLSDRGLLIFGVIHCSDSNPTKAIGNLGSALERKCDALFLATILNADAPDDERIVRIRHHVARGRTAGAIEIQSFEKMPYLAGEDIPQHYINLFYRDKGEEPPEVLNARKWPTEEPPHIVYTENPEETDMYTGPMPEPYDPDRYLRSRRQEPDDEELMNAFIWGVPTGAIREPVGTS